MGRLFTLLVVVAAIVWFVRRSGLLAKLDALGSGALGGGAMGGVAPGEGVFRARFEDGHLVESHGMLPTPLRVELSEIAERERLTGEVTLESAQRLTFSASIPPGARQRLRNVLVNSR